jgi:hypothetical protein
MPDYDVQALALAVPPASAPVASYYPAVSVRNNGIHPAPVTGTLRIHDKAAGTLVATLALLSTSNINPGATAAVPATTAWSPTTSDIGKQFLFSAEVTTPLDQVPANNQLSPVTVLVTAEPPAPPPVTVRHAPQHEHDGADEIDVSGLPGVLASGQYPKPHKYSHGIDGDDMLNVDGLPGELYDSQPALAHGNERHTAAYTTEGALTAHNNSGAAHANSANLEHTAAKGVAGGYAALDASTRVPKDQLGTGQGTTGEFLRGDRTWAAPAAAAGVLGRTTGAQVFLPTGPHTVLTLPVSISDFAPGSALHLIATGYIFCGPIAIGSVILDIQVDGESVMYTALQIEGSQSGSFWLECIILGVLDFEQHLLASGTGFGVHGAALDPVKRLVCPNYNFSDPLTTDFDVMLLITLPVQVNVTVHDAHVSLVGF